MTDDEELRAAFKAGFQQSAEGFNGEYSPSGADLDAWLDDRFDEWKEERDGGD